MFAGPIFTRELLTSPRQLRHYLIRAGYVAGLMALIFTVWLATIGFEDSPALGMLARFGQLVFHVMALVQLSLVLFFALLFSASEIAQEKDRQTLILLLMTDLKDRELVLGKLGASLLMVFVLIAASLPAFFLVYQLGGMTAVQIGWALGLCAATGLAAGSWGSLVAFWREKTFQTLAVSMLGVVLFLGLVEAGVGLCGEKSAAGTLLGLFDPYRTLFRILSPLSEPAGIAAVETAAWQSMAALVGLSAVCSTMAARRLRRWNPSQAVYRPQREAGAARRRHRLIWSNPVLWREIRTAAYGRKVILIKLAYVALAGFVGYRLLRGEPFGEAVMGMLSPLAFSFAGLALLTLTLVNAQAVTALTSERDGKTLEQLLMTDITAREFIFGKLGGALYNWKESILIPLLLAGYFVVRGDVSLENFVYLLAGYAVLIVFSAVLGLHAGLSYPQSRTAIANSLGTLFFLFIGIFISMLLLIEARTSFALQLLCFGTVIGAGSIALAASLMHRNPSMALLLSAMLLPFLTFYAVTEFLRGGTAGVAFWISAAYGFSVAAMLIPAVSEFDAALGRTTHEKG